MTFKVKNSQATNCVYCYHENLNEERKQQNKTNPRLELKKDSGEKGQNAVARVAVTG